MEIVREVVRTLKSLGLSAWDIVPKAEAYILEHIYLGMRVEGLRRVDVPEIARDNI